MADAEPEPNLRTPLELAIKTITTHAFALGSYAYVCNLLRRPTRSHIQAIRLLFFAFVPTLPLVELLISAIRSLIHFIRNYENDEHVHLRYYCSSALGMHASRSQDDDNKDTSDSSKNLHLLNVGSHCAEKHLQPVNWVWVGQLFAAFFALTQAVGTIVMWVRRMKTWEAEALSFDHRNGALGVASAICSTICILVLLIRLRWKVSKSFEVETQKDDAGWNWKYLAYSPDQKSQFVSEAVLAMLLHMIIATIPNEENMWLYSSVGSVAFLVTGSGGVFLQGWQTVILLVFIFIFRHDIARRLGINFEQYQKYFANKQVTRMKLLVGFLLVVWLLVDIVWLFVVDIIQVVKEGKDRRIHNSHGYIGYWWQDPLSDSLIVI